VKNDRTRLLGGDPIIPKICEGPGEPGLVSVLIPSYNRGYIIGKSIESVLAQTYRPMEIVVVDDGSTDETRAVVAQFGSAIRYIYQDNGGLAAARNTGLAAAHGEFIAFQDSDDLWLPWKLQVQVALMQRLPELALVWTDMTAVNPQGRVVSHRYLQTGYHAYHKIQLEDYLSKAGRVKDVCPDSPPDVAQTSFRYGDIFSAMFLGNLVHPPTVLLRRHHLCRIGGLDETFAWAGEDYEFFWRVCREGLGALVEAPSMLYRVDAEDQMTHPALHLYIARGYLLALQRRLEQDRHRIKLPSYVIRRQMAEAYGWVAETALLAGDGHRAAGYFLKSLLLNPAQKRALTLLPFSLVPRRLLRLARRLKQRLSGMLPLGCFWLLETPIDSWPV
jgi:glycosyltransferase involved in cell wall biosynthesis